MHMRGMDAKLLESKRPVILDGAGAQTSFKDQLRGLDGLGLRLLLYENPPEPKPKVLLRHSGTMATLPAGKIAKRDENHVESQLPINPYGMAGETSCKDQVQSTAGLGLCPPLHETRLEPKHKIFLSHSGTQKSFVKQLCKDIERYDRYPFFDILRTSLSIGCDFPKEIFKAIEQCHVAVVVLSEDFFFRTKWPMLELSALVKRKGHDPSLIIMPVFLGLTREQCREKENHDRWLSLWERWAKEDPRIILDDWKIVFKVFGYINSVSLCSWDEVKCREDIVDAICMEVPPETRRDDSHVQGRQRMYKIVGEKIGGMELSKCYKVCVLGLYGVGGIGKSTACMTLCNHYFEEFHGQVCHVEFGAMDNLCMLREILKRLTDTKHEQIEGLNFDECKYRLKDIKKQKILLAIDNVFESYEIVEQAKLILKAGFANNSIVIVIARSLGELQNLNIKKRECIEMPELTMEDAMSLFVREVSCDEHTNEHLIRQCINRCYFRKEDGSNFHYHPMALRVLGSQLGSDSSEWLEKLEEIDVFNQYRENPHKHPIFSILRRSFDILNDEDKLLFMDCALFAIYYSYPLGTNDDIYHWLSMIHGKQIKFGRKSLIQTLEEGTTCIAIHDLWREFCIMETKVGELKSRRWIYEQLNGSNNPYIEESNVYGGVRRWINEQLSSSNNPCFKESNVYGGVWKKAERITIMGSLGGTCNVQLNLSRYSNLISLHLGCVTLEGNVLDLNGVYNLKSLKIEIYSNCEVYGLGLLKRLSILEWHGEMPSNMAFIEEIGGLTNLQILNLSNYMLEVKIGLPNLSNLSLLQQAAFGGFNGGVIISFNSTMSNIQQLHLEDCESLQWYHGKASLVEVEELEISSCSILEELSNFQVLKNLKKLIISRCDSIQTLLGVDDLVSLLELEACNLVELPNLNKLTNLQVLQLKECSINRAMMELSELINLQDCRISFDMIGGVNDLHMLTKLQSFTIEGWSLEGSLGVDSLVNLKDLSIEDCKGVSSLGGLSKISGLCNVTLRNCEFKDVACLKDLIGLHKVLIHGCNLLESFPDMHKATRLESIRILECKNLQMWEGLNRTRVISSEAILVDLESSGKFPSLQILSLRNLPITEIPDLSNFPELYVFKIRACQNLVKVTSIIPLTSLIYFHVYHCSNLISIPNFNGCKHLERILVQRSGITLSENEVKYLRSISPTILINID